LNRLMEREAHNVEFLRGARSPDMIALPLELTSRLAELEKNDEAKRRYRSHSAELAERLLSVLNSDGCRGLDRCLESLNAKAAFTRKSKLSRTEAKELVDRELQLLEDVVDGMNRAMAHYKGTATETKAKEIIGSIRQRLAYGKDYLESREFLDAFEGTEVQDAGNSDIIENSGQLANSA